MENLARGMAYIITTGSPLSVSGYLPQSFRFFATGSVFGIPVLFIIFIIISAIAFIFMKYSRYAGIYTTSEAMKMLQDFPV